MTATGRRLQLLATLQASPGATASELAERFVTTPRTIRRDVEQLRELGYRIDATPGRHGGYVLAAGTRAPALVLDDDEAVATGLGLRMVAGTGVAALAGAAVTALAKLEEGLPSRLRARLAAAGQVAVQPAPARPEVSSGVLAGAALACRSGESLWLVHRGQDGRARGRDVHPHRLVMVGGHWYLVAHDVRIAAWRSYRLDRVVEARPSGTRRRPVPDAPQDPVAFVMEGIATGAWRHLVVVRLALDPETARDILDPTLGVVHSDPPGCRLEIGTDDLDWAARRVAALGVDLEVVGPPEFRVALDGLGTYLIAVASS